MYPNSLDPIVGGLFIERSKASLQRTAGTETDQMPEWLHHGLRGQEGWQDQVRHHRQTEHGIMCLRAGKFCYRQDATTGSATIAGS